MREEGGAALRLLLAHGVDSLICETFHVFLLERLNSLCERCFILRRVLLLMILDGFESDRGKIVISSRLSYTCNSSSKYLTELILINSCTI